jgi:hypothetical protein
MADTRTLKLSLLADVDKFLRGMDQAERGTDQLNNTTQSNSKKMTKALGAIAISAGIVAVAIGRDMVKAAADDEVSQTKFRESIKDSTGATDTFIESLDGVIEKMQFQSGFSDGQLRDGLGRLTRSTEDVTEAQDLLELAMDISRGTGKDLDTVVGNLAKAYDGNEGALTRMGIPLSDNAKKSGDFKDITKELTDLFGGQASAYADTYQGKLDIVNQRLGEFKEGAGKGLIDVLGTLLTTVNDVAKGFSGEDPEGLSNRARELAGEFEGNGANSLGGSLRGVVTAFQDLFKALNSSDADGSSSALERIAQSLETFADAINAVTAAYQKAQDLGSAFRKSKVGQFVYAEGQFAPENAPLGRRALGGPVSGGNSYLVGERGPEILTMSAGRNGSITPSGAGGGVTIIMNGVIDGESARRSIERLLQDSSRRTGAINLVGATL